LQIAVFVWAVLQDLSKVETVPVVVDWLRHIGEDVSMEFGTVVDADQR
jgi:hypothetical protein